MSIYSLMTRAATDESVGDQSQVPLRGSSNDLANTPTSVAATLASYIPAEAVAVYTSVLAFLVPVDKALDVQSYGSRWALAAVVAVLAVLYAVGTYKRAIERQNGAFRWPVGKTLLVLVAFAAWVFVIPGSPFGSFDWYTPALGAIGAIVVNAFLGAFALFSDSAAA